MDILNKIKKNKSILDLMHDTFFNIIDGKIFKIICIFIQLITSLILGCLSIVLKDRDHMFDSWYYYLIHVIVTFYGIVIVFKFQNNTKLIFIYILLLSCLVLVSSFTFFWYAGQSNIIHNTCMENCKDTFKYYDDKLTKTLLLTIIEVIALHPFVTWLIKVLKQEKTYCD
ncbi:hypothetical protein CYY_003402 [Polysphondylium violaceum]|uniref:Transmembrane protein n=1 Tax=Polysphondylium violaceum TaxID=133409 RepID=A0A8J4PUS1_9MYCE|nr:hypothetical protein CYY_003402 [Polysphondylium violaceum]